MSKLASTTIVGHQQRRAHQQGIVPVSDRRRGERSEAGPGEDRLDEHRAGDQDREPEAEEGEHREQRVPPGMPPEHLPLGEPLGPSRQYIRKAKGLEHGGCAGSRMVAGDAHDGERERRQDQVPERRRPTAASSPPGASSGSRIPAGGRSRQRTPTSHASTSPSQKDGVA